MNQNLRIAVLDCDIPVPNVYAKRGYYSDIFIKLLQDVASTNQELSQLNIQSRRYDAVGGELPATEDLQHFDAIIITGSGYSAYDPDPWISSLTDFCRTLYTSHPNIKIFGSCFGHQIVCHALFSPPNHNIVSKDPKGWELGVQPIRLSPAFLSAYGPVSSNLSNPSQLRLQFVHADHVTMHTLPPGFHSIGSSAHCVFQGVWKRGRILTYQGHAEFDRFVNGETSKVFGNPSWSEEFLGRALEMVDREDDAIWATTVMLRFFLEDAVETCADVARERREDIGEEGGVIARL
ncbi:class I glutamine amidotransferase-like protein [Tricladium varicosporioides]|nr:class I glutamine amidotransferase-like protein [Hymenoscyphus varicosporioides]